ncbi:hypothetical protein RB601_001024 [Gaeumannomyces tritici]
MSATASSTVGSGLPTPSSKAYEEFYVATFWSYRPRGVAHVLNKARAIAETGHLEVMYDPKQQWFKVICLRDQVSSVQARLVKLLRTLDGDLSWDSVVDEGGEPVPEISHPWIQSLRDCSAWSIEQAQAPLDADHDLSSIDRAELPDSVRHFKAVRCWNEIDDNEPKDVDIDKILPAGSLLELERSTGATIIADGMGRVVYMGGHGQDVVDSAYARLSCLLKHSHDEPFNAVHLLYSEANHTFSVDVRLMSAINPNLVSSSLVDPIAGPSMAEQYKAISGAASLRISLPNPALKSMRSLFGPRQPARFKLEEARRYCQAFNNLRFKAKQKVPKPAEHRSQLLRDTVADKEASVDAYVETWILGVPDHPETPPPCLGPTDQVHQLRLQDRLDKQKKLAPIPPACTAAPPASSNCAINHPVLPALMKKTAPLNAPAAATKTPAPPWGVGVDRFRLQHNGRAAPVQGSVWAASGTASHNVWSRGSGSDATSQLPNVWPPLGSSAGNTLNGSPRGWRNDPTKWPELPNKAVKVSYAPNPAQKSNPSPNMQLPPDLTRHPSSPPEMDLLSEFPALGLSPPSSFLAPGDPETLEGNCHPLSTNSRGGLAARGPDTNTQQYCNPPAGTLSQQASLLDDMPPRMPSLVSQPHDEDPHALINFNMEALVPTKSFSSARPSVGQDDDRSSRVFFETMDQKTASRKKAPNAKKLEPKNQDPEPKFREDLEANIARLSERLRYGSGKVALKIVFGRICLKDFTPSGLATNDKNQEASGWRPEALLPGMAKAYSRPETFLFTRMLSLYGQDADSLGSLPEASSWVLHSRRVVYEFMCDGFGTADSRLGDRAKQFVVEVDAVDFSFTITTPNGRLAPVAIHCLHRHWDFEVVASCSPTRKLEAMYSEFARGLVDSLEIPRNTNRTPTLYYELEPPRPLGGGATAGARVRGVRVRYTARHKCPSGATYLDIDQIQDMAIVSQGMRDGWVRFHSFPARECPEEGRASAWFEGSLSSAKAEDLFKANERLGLGEEAAWTVASMKQDGCFRALWEPALSMVKAMDHIGVATWPARSDGESEAERAPREEESVETEGFW